MTEMNGKTRLKYHRGKPKDPFVDHGSVSFKDYLINKHTTNDIIFPYPRKGKWIYPKPGFIQWDKDAE